MSLAPLIAALIMWYALRLGKQSKGQQRDTERSTNILRILVWMLAVPLALVMYDLVAAGHLRALPWLVGSLVLIFPWALARLVLVPLGLPRLAFAVGHLSGSLFRVDLRGGGLLAAALALHRRQVVTAGQLQWLERRLAKSRPLRGAGVVACGLLAARRGDIDGARALLACVDTADPRVLPDTAREIAAEWLAAEAAERGEWRQVERLGSGQSSRSGRTRLLGAIAARLLHGPSGGAQAREHAAPLDPRGPWLPFWDRPRRRVQLGRVDDQVLWLRWVSAFCPVQMLPLLRRALAQGVVPLPPERQLTGQVAVRPVRRDRLGQALGLHAGWLRLAPHERGPAGLRALGAAWEAALSDPALLGLAVERGLVLGVSESDRVLRELRGAVRGELCALAREAQIDLGDETQGPACGLVQEAGAALRSEFAAEVELSCDAMRSRVDARRPLPLIDEWREWAALRALHTRALWMGGERLRMLVWPKVHPDVCHWAVWLWNERKEYVLANAIFRWLLHQAQHVQDDKAIELQRKNVQANL